MKERTKTGRINAGKTVLGGAVFLALLFVIYSFVVPWLDARLPEGLALIGGGFIFFGPMAAGYLLSWTRIRLARADNVLAAAIAGAIFGAIFSKYFVLILVVAAITAFSAWVGSTMAVFFMPQSDSEEGGE